MSNEKPSLTQMFATWVQCIGILVAAGLGFYQFFYKEIKAPRTAPINISMNLQLKKVGTGEAKNLIAVEMRVSASNPSSRRVYLLPTAFAIYGHKLLPSGASKDFVPQAQNLMNAQHAGYLSTHASNGPRYIVAAGSLFQDWLLSPQETISRSIIVHIPRNEYDQLEAFSEIISTEIGNTAEASLKLEWKIDDEGEINPLFYIYSQNGGKRPAEKEDRERYGVLKSTSRASLCLWD